MYVTSLTELFCYVTLLSLFMFTFINIPLVSACLQIYNIILKQGIKNEKIIIFN